MYRQLHLENVISQKNSIVAMELVYGAANFAIEGSIVQMVRMNQKVDALLCDCKRRSFVFNLFLNVLY